MTPCKAAVKAGTGIGYAAIPPERQFKLLNSHRALDSVDIATQLGFPFPTKLNQQEVEWLVCSSDRNTGRLFGRNKGNLSQHIFL